MDESDGELAGDLDALVDEHDAAAAEVAVEGEDDLVEGL